MTIDEFLNAPRARELAGLLGALKKPWKPRHIRALLRAGSGGECEYRRSDLFRSSEAFWSSQWDHVVPKRHGGEDSFASNIAAVCFTCNRVKGSDVPGAPKVSELLQAPRESRVAAFTGMVRDQREEYELDKEFEAACELVMLFRAAC